MDDSSSDINAELAFLDGQDQAHQPEALYQAGILYQQQGAFKKALELLEQAAGYPTTLAKARARQATLLRQLQRPKEAFPLALQAINADMSLVEGWECAGSLLMGNKKWPEASRLMALAIKAVTHDATLHAYYALALAKDGQPVLGYHYAQKALQLQPDLLVGILARIEALCELGYYDLALQDTSLLQGKNAPDAAAFRFGSLAFMNGDTTRGMKAMTAIINSGWRYGEVPEWNGKATDQHVVFYGGQGYGDMLQFARYIKPMLGWARNVSLHLPRNLTRLMGDSFPGLLLSIHEDDVKNDAIPVPVETAIGIPKNTVLRSSLPSLATFTETGFDPRADSVPYLCTRPALSAAWRERLAHMPRPWIGIVWAPGTWFNSNPSRSISYDMLKPIIAHAKPHLISLQLGAESKKAAKDGLYDAAPLITDFADSAALVNELDLLITFDSAPAHLAGALGKPVWTMLHFNADWRWLVGREDSIWYPSMRLFRQTQHQDWPGVVRRLCFDLEHFLAGDKGVLKAKPWFGPTPVRSPYVLPLPPIA